MDPGGPCGPCNVGKGVYSYPYSYNKNNKFINIYLVVLKEGGI